MFDLAKIYLKNTSQLLREMHFAVHYVRFYYITFEVLPWLSSLRHYKRNVCEVAVSSTCCDVKLSKE